MPTPHTQSRDAEADADIDRVRGRLMQQSLSALLDRVRGARDALPHLAALEAGLGKRGTAAIRAIPPQHRARICSQLSSLPLPEDDSPLQDLQRRLLASLDDRPRPISLQPESDMERTVVVQEISHSEFMAAAAAQGMTPGQEPG
jgi:signal transduction protein with GAF and PtsI domain